MSNLELIVGRGGGSPLAEDYVAGLPRARAFFEGWWGDPDAYVEKAREVAGRFDRAGRERAARALRCPDEAARARLSAWVESGGFAVTTGQQPGLFTGPLYTVYKALTAARLAGALEEALEAPVIAIFWVASEDHDWEESNHTFLVGGDNELHRVEVPAPQGEEGRPIHRIHPGGALPLAVQAFLAQLPGTEFGGRYRELLERAYTADRTLSEGFHDVLGALLAPFGVYLADAADPAVKEATRPLLALEVERSEAHEQLLAERAADLSEHGYSPQVAVLPGGLNLFVEGPRGRERVYRSDRDDRFHLRHSGESLTRSELLARIEAGDTVSPNVLLRPIAESVAFPTVSLVVGPGEAAYFAQLQPYFGALGVRPPVAYPRFTVTAVEPKVRKVMDKFGMDLRELRRPFHELAAEVARDELPEEARLALEEIRRALDEGSTALADAVKDIHTTLAGSVQRARSVSADAWADAEKKILQALRRENETRLAQLEKAQRHIFPNGRPQERSLNVFYYLFRYGDAFLAEVAERFEVHLGAGAPHR
jgi:bacillithiol biosynthesis cysteine-adding enzyme BshC